MSTNTPLDDLRKKIDTIDDAIHDLIIARTKVIEQVREEKRGQNIKIRPARECSIMYRLMERHKGPFPRRELARIWRELIVASLSFEGSFSIGAHVPDIFTIDQPRQNMRGKFLSMIRNQYGSFTPMSEYSGAKELIDAVRKHEVAIGVLSMPCIGEEVPWWPLVASQANNTPRIINRLPFISVPEESGENIDALVICPVPSAPTGNDHTFLIVESVSEISQDQLATAFTQANIKTIFSTIWYDPEITSRYLYLVEAMGFITNDDNKIHHLSKYLDAFDTVIWTIGSYGLPLEL